MKRESPVGTALAAAREMSSALAVTDQETLPQTKGDGFREMLCKVKLRLPYVFTVRMRLHTPIHLSPREHTYTVQI